MRSTVEEAEMLVTEMGYLFQAKFEVTKSGPNREARWHYETAPSCREAARAFLKGYDLTRPGFDAAIIEAVRRLERRRAG